MQELLKQSERTEKAADETPPDNSHGQQEARNVKAELETRRCDDCLQGSYGAGKGRRRTGVAVEPRHAQAFPLSLVELARQKIVQPGIGHEKGKRLDELAPDGLPQVTCPLLGNVN